MQKYSFPRRFLLLHYNLVILINYKKFVKTITVDISVPSKNLLRWRSLMGGIPFKYAFVNVGDYLFIITLISICFLEQQ